MKYIKSKYLNIDGELYSFRQPHDETIKCFHYDRKDGWDYWGIDTLDLTPILAVQNTLCEVTEVLFDDIQPILKKCRMYKEINESTVFKIREQYDVNTELSNMKLEKTDPVYIEMTDYIQLCRQGGNKIKKQFGLKQ